MQIIEKRLDEIRPYENNPRKNEAAVKYVASSIREFGFKVPIVIDSGGEIVAGHTRYKAAQELGLETVPCVVADDLTPQQIKAFRLADNKTAEMAGWDFEALDFELEGVGDLDMGLFGFENDVDLEKAIDDFFADNQKENEKNLRLVHALTVGINFFYENLSGRNRNIKKASRRFKKFKIFPGKLL